MFYNYRNARIFPCGSISALTRGGTAAQQIMLDFSCISLVKKKQNNECTLINPLNEYGGNIYFKYGKYNSM